MKRVGILFVSAVMMFLAGACGGNNSSSTGWEEAIGVEVLVVSGGQSSTERNYVGDIGSEREASLSFLMGGTLKGVYVKNGQYVKAGTLLAKVDTTAAGSLHSSALATLRQAEDAYRRLERVHKEGGLSDVKWVEMETNLEKARQAELSMRKHLEDCSVRAPFGGVVVCEDCYVGQEMRPMETFARVLDMTKLRVTFSVPEQEITAIVVGSEATATVPALRDKKLHLRIADKSMVSNPLGHTYRVSATVNAADLQGLLPDMVAKVTVRTHAGHGVVIPATCIHTMREGNSVWVIAGGEAHRKIVEVGDFVKNGVRIVSGLSDGDTLVTKGHHKLYNGAKVVVR